MPGPHPYRRWLLTAALGLTAATGVGAWQFTVAAASPDPIEPRTAPPTALAPATTANRCLWPHAAADQSLAERFPPPPGYLRLPATPGSFQAWLRALPLRPNGSLVRAFDGQTILADDDPRLAAVLDWDIGTKNLQQCADSVIRLRAEWAFARSPHADIGFDFTSGDRCSWSKWRRGYRPAVVGNSVRFLPTASADDSYGTFRAYLDKLFQYAGTVSLRRESQPATLGDSRPAFLIHPGTPGHVIMLLDIAADPTCPGTFAVLLGQGFMPAQDFHLLTAPGSRRGPSSAWHRITTADPSLTTPFGTYSLATDLRTFAPIANLPE